MDNKQNASRRLQRDMLELQRNPLPYCCAEPLEDNIFKWHVNFVPLDGPYRGLPIHLHISFSHSYPLYPPTVEMMTRGFNHPNVFGDFVCLDMLRAPTHWSKPYSGWSSAYTLSAILTQLYGFLMVDSNIEQDYGGVAKRSKCRNRRLEGSAMAQMEACHCGFRSLPAAVRLEQDQMCQSSQNSVVLHPPKSSMDLMDAIGPDVLRNVVRRLDLKDISALRDAAGTGHSAGKLAMQRISELNLFCFHSKKPHDEPGTILGYCLHATRYEKIGFFPLKKPVTLIGRGCTIFPSETTSSSKVRTIELAGYDYISEESFSLQRVRRSAWNIPFTGFLPLYLNPTHGRRSLPIVRRHMSQMLGGAYVSMSSTDMLIFCLGRLMNSLIVSLYLESDKDKRHMCDAAVQAFFHLHHLLLAVAWEVDNEFIAAAERDVMEFVQRPEARHKEACPDLGILLLKLLLIPCDTMPWGRFAPVFVRELLCRQVRWVERTNGMSKGGIDYFNPQKDVPGEKHDYERIQHHLKHATTSLRVVALETWLANVLSRPRKAETAHQELSSIKRTLDENSGQAPEQIQVAFWSTFKVFGTGKRFSDYFNRMGVCPKPMPTHRATLACMLRQAVVDSKKAEYHKGPWLDYRIKYMDWRAVKPLQVYKGPWLHLGMSSIP